MKTDDGGIISCNSRHDLDELGFVLARGALSADKIAVLVRFIDTANSRSRVRTRGRGAFAARNLLWDRPETGAALADAGLDRIAEEALGAHAFPINATYFDKTAGANWAVPGHQDVMMPVEQEVAEPGFTGWSNKLGVVYVDPPADILSRLIALRVHLDDCPAENGSLAVVAGSHRRGKLRDPEIAAVAPDDYTVCAAAAGDVLLMRPLIIHRSSPAVVPSHRRVLHVVYAADEPGVNVRWKRARPNR